MEKQTEEKQEELQDKHLDIPFSPFGGATSMNGALDFLDQRERQHKVEDLTWMFRTVVNNILDADTDFSQKVGMINVATEELSTEIGEVRSKSVFVRIKDSLHMLKQGGFDTSPFKGAASNWSTTEAYCKSCLIDVNPSGEEKTQARCALPLTKEGSSKPNLNALRTMGTGRGIAAVKKPAGVSASTFNAAKKKAANRIISLWPKAFDKPAPAAIFRIAGKSPPKDSKATTLYRSKETGKLHWWGMVSNNFRDRDKEILTKEAHQRFVQVFNEVYIPAKAYPEWLLWHTKNAALGIATWAEEINGFLVMGGEVYPECEEIAIKSQDEGWNAMSHGFIPTEINEKDNLVEEYFILEVSALPVEFAANAWTSIEVIQEKDFMSKDRQEHLEELVGPELAAIIDGKTGTLRDGLQERGVESKEVDPDVAVEDASAEEVVSEPEVEEATEDEKAIDVIVQAVAEVLDLKSLSEYLIEKGKSTDARLDELTQAINNLQQDDDKKLDEKMDKTFETYAWKAHRATEQKDNVVPEGEEPAVPSAEPDTSVMDFFTAAMKNGS